MILESMHATFGKLKTETLSLNPGLNILEMPNETGKSTWCAFLLAMLYGVDTSERESKANFPVKKHYAPWSGSAMEGKLLLEQDGQRITIERKSTARAPLGVFRAFLTETGQPLPELTSQTCGQSLLGIPRQVFERSAFLRQDGIAISMDDTLEQRLGALVSSGDELISYQQAERILRERRNRCRHNHTGLIPQTQAKLDDLNERLTRLEGLHDILARARADEKRLQGNLRVQKLQLSALQARLAAERRTQLIQIGEEATKKMDEAQKLEAACRDLPPMTQLEDWERELSQLEARQHTLALDFASLPQPKAAPAMPKPFLGLNNDAIKQRANVDESRMRLLEKQKKPSPLWWSILSGLFAIAGGICAFQSLSFLMWVAFAAAVCVALGGAISFLLCKRKWKQAQRELEQYYHDYGIRSPDALCDLADQCREAYKQWESDQRKREQELEELNNARTTLDQDWEKLLQIIRPILGSQLTVSDAPGAVRTAIAQLVESENASRTAEQAYRHYLSLKEAIGDVPDKKAPEVEIPQGKTITTLQAEIFSNERELQQVRSTIDRGEGQFSTLGDPIELKAKQQQLMQRLEALEEEYDALSTAITALGKANEQLQKQFSPQLTELSAAYLSRLTGGAYTKLVLERDLAASLYAADAPASREAAYFSGGTRDQLYLAVRLAVSRLLAPEAPLILDDALVRFDDQRLTAALKVLKDEAKTRQVLLFTCQSREKASLKTL